MKKNKCMISTVLAILLIASILAGCSKPVQTSGPNAAQQSTDGSSKTTGNSTGNTTVKPVEIWYAAEEIVNPTGTIDLLKDSLLTKLNIELRFDIIAKSSYAEKLNVMIASDDFPDLIDSTGIPRMGEAIDAGLILPVTDILENDENWKTVDKRMFELYNYKGEIYGLPVVLDRPNAIYYREDWLNNLNLPVPKTIDELYNVLKAFSENDPDQNGKDDTYGLVMNSSYGQTQPVWFLFLPGSPTKDNGFYYDNDAKKVKNVFQLKDDITDALLWLKKLYDEQILDPEFVLTNSEEEENKFITGKSGAWLKGILWIEPRQAKLEKNFPGGSLSIFPAIEGKYGSNMKQIPSGRAIYLTRAVGNNIEAGKKAIAYISGPEGIRELYYGREGVTYRIQGNEIIWTNPDDASKYNPGNLLSSAYTIQPLVPAKRLMRNLEIVGDYEIQKFINPTMSETYKTNGADFKKVITEGITKIIIGEQPITYLDTIINDLNKLGMETICEEMNSYVNNN